MKKSSFTTTLITFFGWTGLLFFIGMIYWSSLGQETALMKMASAQNKLQEDIRNVEQKIDDFQQQLFSRPMTVAPATSSPITNTNDESEKIVSKLANTGYKNLLKADPFKTYQLPKLLGKNFRPYGTRRAGFLGSPDNLHPFNNMASVASLWSYCLPRLAGLHIGKFEDYAPELALKIEKRPTEEPGGYEFWVFLRPDVTWQPINPKFLPASLKLSPHFMKAHPVTAEDFKFQYDTVMNKSVQSSGALALRSYYDDIESFKVIDKHTFVVRWKRHENPNHPGTYSIKYDAFKWTAGFTPLPRFVYQYYPDGSKIVEDDSDPNTYATHSIWGQTFTDHWAKQILISCGPWIPEQLNEEVISFKRNPDYFDPLAALTERVKFYIRNSTDSLWQDFKAGLIDTYTLSPDQLGEMQNFLKGDLYQKQKENGAQIHYVRYLYRAYNYIGWNMNKELFKSRKVRKALDMAINRQKLISQNLNNLASAITGPFFYNSPSYDKSITPAISDHLQAISLLEEEGWFDSDGDGVREKQIGSERVPFRFKLTYYVHNEISKRNCEMIASYLKPLGIDCQTQGVDENDLSTAMDEKSFDAIYMGWALGIPPEDPRQLWHSKGASQKGSSNLVAFSNARADAIIEELTYTIDPGKRKKLYHEMHQLLYREAPYSFLYSPEQIFLYRDRIQNVFLPEKRQDLIPGAQVAEPQPEIFWIKEPKKGV